MMLPDVELITVQTPESTRKFVVLSKVIYESHKEDLHGMVWLRRNGDPYAYIVDEIKDAVFEDIVKTSEPTPKIVPEQLTFDFQNVVTQ